MASACVNPIGHGTKSMWLVNWKGATGECQLPKDMKLSCTGLRAIMLISGQDVRTDRRNSRGLLTGYCVTSKFSDQFSATGGFGPLGAQILSLYGPKRRDRERHSAFDGAVEAHLDRDRNKVVTDRAPKGIFCRRLTGVQATPLPGGSAAACAPTEPIGHFADLFGGQ
jgi:hypothetical protein